MHAHAQLSTAKSTQSAAGLGHPSLSMFVLSSLSMAWCIVPPTSTTAASMMKLAAMYLSSLVMVCRGGDHQRQRGRDAAAVVVGRIRESHQREAREQPGRQRHVAVVVAQLLAAHAQGGGEGRERPVAGDVFAGLACQLAIIEGKPRFLRAHESKLGQHAAPLGTELELGAEKPVTGDVRGLAQVDHLDRKLLLVDREVFHVQLQKEGALEAHLEDSLAVFWEAAGVQQLSWPVTGQVLWLDLVQVPPRRQLEVLPGTRVHWKIFVSRRVCAFGQDKLENELAAEVLLDCVDGVELEDIKALEHEWLCM
eukprot:scaffold56435_cov65-Phaeocystis_antarctica.AAC.1